MIAVRPGLRSALPEAPFEIADAVELYAREFGRHGRIRFVPHVNCWLVELSPIAGAPLMKAVQEGRLPEPEAWEAVWLQEANPNAGKVTGRGPNGFPIREGPYRSLDIEQLGAAGVRAFLDRTNMFSGRGEAKSLEDAMRQTADAEAARVAKLRADAKDDAIHEARDRRSLYEHVPREVVGVDLNPEKAP